MSPVWHSRGLVAILACLLVLSVGCPRSTAENTIDLPALTSEDPEAEADMDAAKEALASGNTEDAKQRFERFLAERGDDPLAPIAHLGLGRILLSEGEATEARAHFAAVAAHETDLLTRLDLEAGTAQDVLCTVVFLEVGYG